MPKLRSDSFAAGLTPAQRDELFALLAGGKSLAEAARWVRGLGAKAPSQQALSAWYAGARIERRYSAAKESALVAQANCPADYTEAARRALGQARFLATLEDLAPKEIAALEKIDLTREKLDLDRQRLAQDQRVTRRDLALDRARILLERVRGGEKGAGLQSQIDLALAEIQRLKTGEDAQ